MNVRCGDCGSVFRVDPSRVPDAGIRARCSVCGGVIPIGKQGAIEDDFAARLRVTPARVSVVDPEPGVRAPGRSPVPAARVPSAAPASPPAPPPVAPRAFTPPAAPTRPAMPTPATQPATRPWSGARAENSAALNRSSRTPPVGVGVVPPKATAPTSGSPNLGERPAPPRPAGTPPRPAPMPPASSPPPEPSADRGTGRGGRAPTAGSATAAPPARQAPASEVRRPINPFLANDPNARARRLARALVSDIVTYFPDKHREGLAHRTLPLLFKEEIKKSYEEYREQVGTDFAESTTHFQDALNEILAQGGKVF